MPNKTALNVPGITASVFVILTKDKKGPRKRAFFFLNLI
jgi:hypothetical protein